MKRHRDARYSNFLKAECLLSLRKKGHFEFHMSCNFLSHLLYLALLKTYFANYFIFFEGGGLKHWFQKFKNLQG